MDILLPDRETAKARGWTYQVQWVDEGRPYFIRCKSGQEADDHADRLKKSGAQPVVTDLCDALQLH